ncbi:MAG TPA: hypothetical protein VGJ35_11645, partial [Burkholderiaceae bacterium]
MPKPRALLACALAAALSLPALADEARGQSAAARQPFTAKIIGFNDYHGNLQTPGTFGENTSIPAAQRPAVG